jgi:hypothetical protein
MTTPHYLRFAQALALVSGLAGVTACADSHAPDDAGMESDGSVVADSGARDAGRRDAGHDAGTPDAGFTCDMCGCWFGVDAGPGSLPDCDSTGHFECCAAIGPLFPPDLPV